MRRPLEGKKVLVVEDEYLQAIELEEALLELGAEVVGPFGQLSRALAAAGQALDGAVLDVRLNGNTVFPLAEQLRSAGVPIILAIASEATRLPDGLRGLPLLRKPYDGGGLRRILAEVLAR